MFLKVLVNVRWNQLEKKNKELNEIYEVPVRIF